MHNDQQTRKKRLNKTDYEPNFLQALGIFIGVFLFFALLTWVANDFVKVEL